MAIFIAAIEAVKLTRRPNLCPRQPCSEASLVAMWSCSDRRRGAPAIGMRGTEPGHGIADSRRAMAASSRNEVRLARQVNYHPPAMAVLLALALIAIGCEVAAHARVKRANPAVGGVVSAAAAPSELQVWFTEKLEPALSTIEVVDQVGTRMDRGDARIDPDDHTELRVTLLPLPPGRYRVIWRVVSIDTHFRSGSFPFRVDP
jgi:hypothetical protein